MSVMVSYARFDSNGRYVEDGIAPSDSITLHEPDIYVGKIDPSTQYHDLETGEPVNIPPAPSSEHEFNFPAKEWRGDIAKLKEKRHKAIEAIRDRRLNDPTVSYGDIVLDADAQAKQNLQDKITATSGRIARGTPTPPQMLVWKDHANVIHPFSDLAAYKDWLDGFAVVLENRGMEAWAWSWQAKDQLAALTTFDQVIAFNPVPPWAV